MAKNHVHIKTFDSIIFILSNLFTYDDSLTLKKSFLGNEYITRERSLLYKSKGKYHCTVNLLKNRLDMAVVDININVLYNPVRPVFWAVDGTSFPLLL